MNNPKFLKPLVAIVIITLGIVFLELSKYKTVEGRIEIIMAVKPHAKTSEERDINFNYIVKDNVAYQLKFTGQTQLALSTDSKNRKGIKIAPVDINKSIVLYPDLIYRAEGRSKRTKGSYKGHPVKVLSLSKLAVVKTE